MKKFISFVLTLILVLGLIGCNHKSMDYIIQNKPNVTGVVEKVHDDYFIMYSESAEGYLNGSRWSISLNPENKDSYTDVVIGDEVVVYYDGMAMETVPLQVATVFAITLKTPADRTSTSEEIISYNGKEYLKSELCDATLHWLELSEQERMLSSYMPPEFMIFDETWGITLTAENITPTSATIRCIQSGGEPTGELDTGSWYILENWTQENGWKEMPYVIDGEIGWTAEAWMIPRDNSCEWEVKWEWLYGQVPAGKYRIGKEIMDFRGPGDYDKAIYYVEFVIE